MLKTKLTCCTVLVTHRRKTLQPKEEKTLSLKSLGDFPDWSPRSGSRWGGISVKISEILHSLGQMIQSFMEGTIPKEQELLQALVTEVAMLWQKHLQHLLLKRMAVT